MGAKVTYKNPWHKPGYQTEYGPEFFETSARPVEYRGFLIFHREPTVWDAVLNGWCVSQLAGLNGAKLAIDTLLSSNADETQPASVIKAFRAARNSEAA